MKKVLLILGLLLTTQSLSARTFDQIQSLGMLRIGVPADYAPLAYFDNNRLVGFDIDLAKDLARSLNVVPVFVISSWPTLSQDLADDKFDIAMGGVTYTTARAEQFLLSKQIVPNGKIALASCASAPKLVDLQNINQAEVKVLVNPGGTNESFVNRYIDTAQVIRVKNNIDNLQALRDKTADMMVTDLIEGYHYAYTEPGVLCMATTTPFTGTKSYKAYMMQKQNDELLIFVDNWLAHEDIDNVAKRWGVHTSND